MLIANRVIDRHSELSGLTSDDHSQYVHTTIQRTITSNPIFSSNGYGQAMILKRIVGQTVNLLNIYDEGIGLLASLDKDGNWTAASFTGSIASSNLTGTIDSARLPTSVVYTTSSNTFTVGNQKITIDDNTKKGLTIKAAALQGVNNFEIVDSSDVNIFSIGSKGAVILRTDSLANLFTIRNSANTTYIKFDNSNTDATPQGRLTLYSESSQKLSLYTDGTNNFLRSDGSLKLNIDGTVRAILDSSGALSVATLDDVGAGVLYANTNFTVNGLLTSGTLSTGATTINGVDAGDNGYTILLGGPTVSITAPTAGTTLSYAVSTGILTAPHFAGDGASLTGIIPTQTGNNGKFLTTNGSALSWATVSAGAGTVTSVSVVSANGFAGTVATATSTPAITLSTSITGILKGNGTAISAASSGTDYEVPITFSTGLTRTTNTVTVNTTQNITKLSGLTTNGFVKTSGSDGSLSIDTSTYLTGNQSITLSGQASGSGATSISVTLDNASVIGKVLTGYTSGAGTVAATDTILQAIQKLNGNIAALPTISGTTDRITVSTGVVDIAATYVGQTSITTLGTVATGTWSATAIGATKGGTSQTTYALGDILYSSATDTLSKLAGNTTATLKVLTQTGNGSISAAPAWNQIATSNLSDASNIALLNASNTFTGTTNTFLASGSNATKVIIKAGSSQSTTNLSEWHDNAGFVHNAITTDYGFTCQYDVSNPKWKFFPGNTGQLLFMNTTAGTYPLTLQSTGEFTIGATTAYGLAFLKNTISTAHRVLTLRGIAGQAVSYQEWQNSSSEILCAIDSSGYSVFASGQQILWSSSATDATSTKDIGLKRSAAGKLQVTDGSSGYGKIIADNNIDTILVTFDGGGSVLAATSGVYRQIQTDGTIVSWTLLADQSGSVTIDVKTSTYINFPSTSSITAAATPALSSVQKNTDSTLTGWTTTLTAGDVIEFAITGTPTSITRATLVLKVRRA